MYCIEEMTDSIAREISGWKYADEYEIYSFEEGVETIAELMNGEYYSCTDQEKNLIGYFCYGKSAQIPTVQSEIYNGGALDIGLGLKPELCGRGLGEKFLKAGMNFAGEKWNPPAFRLSVACFTWRAIKVYTRLGFQCRERITHRITHMEFQKMVFKL